METHVPFCSEQIKCQECSVLQKDFHLMHKHVQEQPDSFDPLEKVPVHAGNLLSLLQTFPFAGKPYHVSRKLLMPVDSAPVYFSPAELLHQTLLQKDMPFRDLH